MRRLWLPGNVRLDASLLRLQNKIELLLRHTPAGDGGCRHRYSRRKAACWLVSNVIQNKAMLAKQTSVQTLWI
jgi:hypothetical protein